MIYSDGTKYVGEFRYGKKHGVDRDEISYSGYSPNSFADIYKGNWKVGHEELSGKLHLPDGEGPFPAVVIQHGSGHPKYLEPWLDIVIPALLLSLIHI